MPNEHDVLRELEDDLPPSLTGHTFAARARVERIRWRTVLLLADFTAVVAFATGVLAGSGGLGFAGFLATCALAFVHALRLRWSPPAPGGRPDRNGDPHPRPPA
ncbi:hypothetical protein [Amycolatopsis jiangsuensis]|uniref:DUF3040 domain-containing protein n=1 Tax=Amycolatopsis jiangsuensis TaxID=1181879 RepID=A0A840ISR8_9PSEU|nr:hypothetical protein [Amycolatopsis jiangsuensis]MBB4684188.1 hypothetical protein [Amycolatopsis jiangsuensis]